MRPSLRSRFTLSFTVCSLRQSNWAMAEGVGNFPFALKLRTAEDVASRWPSTGIFREIVDDGRLVAVLPPLHFLGLDVEKAIGVGRGTRS